MGANGAGGHPVQGAANRLKSVELA